MRASMYDVRIAAATESSVCSDVSSGPISREQRVDVLRLDGDDDQLRALERLRVRRRRPDTVPLVEPGGPRLAARRHDDLVARAPAGAEQPREQGLADAAGADDRDPSLLRHCAEYRYAARASLTGSNPRP